MITLTVMVSAIVRITDITRQPGMKRTCVRLPGRLLMRNNRFD